MAKRKTGTIKKSSNGKWPLHLRLTIQGKQFQGSGLWPNTPEGRAEAYRHKNRLLGLDADGQLVAPGETVASYVEMWIAKLAYKVEGGHIDQYTADNYTSSARSKLAETPLGAMRLTDVDADDIENHYAYLLRSGGHNGKPLSRKSVKNIASIISMVFQSAKRARKIVANPCSDVDAPMKDHNEKRTWAATQTAEFLKLTADHPFGLIWRTIAVTGLRRSEALGLRWSLTDLDQPEGESVVVGVVRWNKQAGVHYHAAPRPRSPVVGSPLRTEPPSSCESTAPTKPPAVWRWDRIGSASLISSSPTRWVAPSIPTVLAVPSKPRPSVSGSTQSGCTVSGTRWPPWASISAAYQGGRPCSGTPRPR